MGFSLHIRLHSYRHHPFRMNKFLRVLALVTTVNFALIASSCDDKKSDPVVQPQVQRATLSGQISPISSITTVTATDASGIAVTATPSSTGAYSFPGLALGVYNLTFTPATGYAIPASRYATLTATGTTAGVTTATLLPASASFKVDGTPVTATHIYPHLYAYITFTVSPGALSGPTVFINIPAIIPTVGTYPLTYPNIGCKAWFEGADNKTYSSNNLYATGPLSGTLTITAVNIPANCFSGTFNFVGYGSNTGSLGYSVNITNGVFTNVPF